MAHTIDKKLINGTEISKRLGCSQSYISRILNGQRTGPKAQVMIERIKKELRANRIAA